MVRTSKPTSSGLAVLSQLKQNIHNLRMRWPIGIKSIDDASDLKLKRLEKRCQLLLGSYNFKVNQK